jgi:hypothetical protein
VANDLLRRLDRADPVNADATKPMDAADAALGQTRKRILLFIKKISEISSFGMTSVACACSSRVATPMIVIDARCAPRHASREGRAQCG